jgi:ABC-type phosphate transport system substrate-binding protein
MKPTILIITVLIMIAFLPFKPAAAEERFVVIINAETQADKLDRKFLADIFLGRATRWSDDTAIRPVDSRPEAPARAGFSQEVLARSVTSIRNYWQQRIFSGQGLPPPELANDEEILTYVLNHRGAIGYVSATTNLNGVRTVQVN